MESKYLKVIDREDLVRDTQSKALLASDTRKLKEHREKLNFFKQLAQQNKEMDQLKNDVSEIKAILQRLVSDK